MQKEVEKQLLSCIAWHTHFPNARVEKKTLTAFTNRCARVWMVWVKFNCYHLVYKPNDFLQQANSIAADFTAQNIENHHIIWLKKLIIFCRNKFIWKNWFLSSIIGNEISIFQLKHLKNVPQLIPIQNYNMKFIRALLKKKEIYHEGQNSLMR